MWRVNYKSEEASSEQLVGCPTQLEEMGMKSFLGGNDLKDEPYERERTNILPLEEIL